MLITVLNSPGEERNSLFCNSLESNFSGLLSPNRNPWKCDPSPSLEHTQAILIPLRGPPAADPGPPSSARARRPSRTPGRGRTLLPRSGPHRPSHGTILPFPGGFVSFYVPSGAPGLDLHAHFGFCLKNRRSAIPRAPRQAPPPAEPAHEAILLKRPGPFAPHR